jgi:branched-chain amino acid transport system ATP-binding protein
MAADAQPLLRIDGLTKSYGGLRAVDHVTTDVVENSLTALIGPNGAGKSSLFNVVTGFERADTGTVLLDGNAIQRLPAFARARRGMVRTFQLTKVLAGLSVLDNMVLAAPRHPGNSLTGSLVRQIAWRKRERAAKEEAAEILAMLRLGDKARELAGRLSGGERKLLELGRALMLRPRLLLLDEPLAGVNPTLGRTLIEHIERLRAERGMTFLFIEHDLEVVLRHADRVIVMSQGRVVADGHPDEVRDSPAVIEAYLGARRAGTRESA